MTWPFPRVKQLGWSLFEKLTSAQITQIDLQQSQAAEAAIWSDVTAFMNFPVQKTNVLGGRLIVYNPTFDVVDASEDVAFVSFNHDGSNNPTGMVFSNPDVFANPQTITGLGTNLRFLNPRAYSYNPTGPVIVVAGAPNTTSQSRMRKSSDGGYTFTAHNSVKATGTDGPIAGIYCGGSIDKHIFGYSTGEIETSGGSDGGTYTNRTVPNANARTMFAYSPTLGMVVCVSSGSANYITSTDGITWTQRTGPFLFHNVFWSDYHQKFIFAGTGSALVYQSLDGINLTQISTLGPASTSSGFWGERGRIMMVKRSSNLSVSVDGGANWKLELSMAPDSTASTNGGSVFANHPNGRRAQWVCCLVDGTHAFSMRVMNF